MFSLQVELALGVIMVSWTAVTVSGAFVCPQDGHFGDEDDCSKYYHCANGRPLPGFCPDGLFWNQGQN